MSRAIVTSFRAARGICFFLLLLLLVSLPAAAQVATGTPPFGSFAGGPDVINLGNNNAHIAIPVINKTGRGTNFWYNLSYDSSIWFPVGSGSSKSWATIGNWGWSSNSAFSSGTFGFLTYSSTTTYCYDGQGHINGADQIIGNSKYYDPWGTIHLFPGQIESKSGGCGNSQTNTYPGVDGSGLILNSPTGPVIRQDGSSFTPPANPAGGAYAALVTDRNGNQVSADSAGHFYDTLSSSTPVLTVSGSGTPTSPATFAYTAPSTGSASYTMKFTTYSIQTNFGCSGIADYGTNGTTTANLVSEIDLPDGSKYSFSYEPTPGHSSFVTGRLASVTFPTGGTISYSYSGGNNGIVCADGSAATLTRTTPDGKWIYAHSEPGTSWTTLITDPQNNQTNMNFQGIYETQRQVYQGSTSGTLLRQWTTCYNGNTSNCNNTGIGVPITQRTVTDQYGSSGLQCQHIYKYNSVGGLTEQDDYDYGSGGPGGLLRQTLITFASLGNNITAFRQQVTVKNGSGTIVSQTNYNYDEPNTLTSTSGIAQHTSVSGSRGNLTSINYPVSGLTGHFTYYDTGSPNTSQDINGATTTYNYSNNTADCQMAFPTSVSEPLSMSHSMTWNCTGGVPASSTDENSQVTNYAWSDPYFWRPASISYPDGGLTSFAYNSQTSVTTTVKMNSSQNIVATQILDALGRAKESQLNSDPEGVVYQDTTYDPLGRIYSLTNPYRSSGESSDGTTYYAYDALSRPTSTTLQDGSISSASYSNNTVTVTDPAGKKRAVVYDSIGRLTQVTEDPGGLGYVTTYSYDALGDLTGVTQNGRAQRTFVYDALSRLTSETNPESGTTTYGYDASGHQGDLTSRVAPAPNQTGSNTVTTTYAYDLLHRLTQKTYSDGLTPTASFVYDISSPWGISVQNPVGRLVLASVSNAGTVSSYDAMGRTSNQWECTPIFPCGSGSYFWFGYSYDFLGDQTSLNHDGGFTMSQTYDSAGRVVSLTNSQTDSQHPSPLVTVDSSVGYYPHGALRKMTFGNGLTQTAALNSALQLCRVNVNSSGTAFSTCTDNPPSGSVQDFTFQWNAGASDNGNVMLMAAGGSQAFGRNFSYDSLNRLGAMSSSAGPSGYTFCAFEHEHCTFSGTYQVAYGANGTFVYQTFTNGTDCDNAVFGDPLVGTFKGCYYATAPSGCTGLSWNYDAWGNRTDQTVTGGTCPSFHQTINTQNRLANSPYQYDAAGNLTADGNHTYTYDAENRLTQVDGGSTAAYIYDASGRRVEKIQGTSQEHYWYDVDGNVRVEWNQIPNWVVDYLYLGSQRVAEYRCCTTYFVHTDQLGSTRLLTGMDQSVAQNLDYLPFGELNSSDSAITTHKFTGDEHDSETNLEHTWFRKYSSSLGRWMTPDPAGLAAVDPSNPQSWNRYSYVLNNPLALTDPLGLSCVTVTNILDDGSSASSIADDGDGQGCPDAGVPPDGPDGQEGQAPPQEFDFPQDFGDPNIEAADALFPTLMPSGQSFSPCLNGNPTISTVAIGVPTGCSSDLGTSTGQKINAAATVFLNQHPLLQPLTPLVDPCVRKDAVTRKNALHLLYDATGGAIVGAAHGGITAALDASGAFYFGLVWDVQEAAAHCGVNPILQP